MIKLYRNILIFFAPIALLLFLMPVDQRAKYLGLKDDCRHKGIWIHDRIFLNDKKTDLVFLGSSHTMNGIDDQLIEDSLHEYGISSANFGYCRLGRNLTYVLLKDLLKNKKPKYVVIELPKNEDRYSHPVFPHMAETGDVLFAHLFFNRDYFSDIIDHLAYKTELTQDIIFKTMNQEPVKMDPFGFTTSPDTALREQLDLIKTKRGQTKPALSKIAQDFYMAFPKEYLDRIFSICQKKNISLLFLYMPFFGQDTATLKDFQWYSQYGKVLMPPKLIFENPDYWSDENHFNKAGANAYSLWLSKNIEEEITQ